VIDLAASVATTDPALLQNIASTVTVEARHDTRISPEWALNLALPFVVPGSCPLSPAVRRFPRLEILGVMTPTTTMITFATTANVTQGMYVGWVNQANVPAYTSISVLAGMPQGVFNTTVPPGMGGMAFAALTGQTMARDVAALTVATLAGPVPVPVS